MPRVCMRKIRLVAVNTQTRTACHVLAIYPIRHPPTAATGPAQCSVVCSDRLCRLQLASNSALPLVLRHRFLSVECCAKKEMHGLYSSYTYSFLQESLHGL